MRGMRWRTTGSTPNEDEREWKDKTDICRDPFLHECQNMCGLERKSVPVYMHQSSLHNRQDGKEKLCSVEWQQTDSGDVRPWRQYQSGWRVNDHEPLRVWSGRQGVYLCQYTVRSMRTAKSEMRQNSRPVELVWVLHRLSTRSVRNAARRGSYLDGALWPPRRYGVHGGSGLHFT